MQLDARFPNLHILDHPLIQHKLTQMRKKETSSELFRRLLKEITMLMGYEVMRKIPTKVVEIETPVAKGQGLVVDQKDIAIVPILRAGLGMGDGFLELMPSAKEGHIGLYRDSTTKRPVEYMVKLPCVQSHVFILLDPMIATGYSAAHAVNVLLENGVRRADISFVSLVASPEGMTVFNEQYADIPMFTAAMDDGLNEHAYIVPGLGDAGDRIFGTK